MYIYGDGWAQFTLGIPTGASKLQVETGTNGGSVSITGIDSSGSETVLLNIGSGKTATVSIVGYEKLYIRGDTWNNNSSASIKFQK